MKNTKNKIIDKMWDLHVIQLAKDTSYLSYKTVETVNKSIRQIVVNEINFNLANNLESVIKK